MQQEVRATPALVRSDVWILTAILPGGGPVEMRQLVQIGDFLMRRMLTFDEVSFGAPRLVAAGLAEVIADDGLPIRLAATSKARSMIDGNPGTIEFMFELMSDLGCRPYPEPEDEDRSLGRLPGLDLATWPGA